MQDNKDTVTKISSDPMINMAYMIFGKSLSKQKKV